MNVRGHPFVLPSARFLPSVAIIPYPVVGSPSMAHKPRGVPKTLSKGSQDQTVFRTILRHLLFHQWCKIKAGQNCYLLSMNQGSVTKLVIVFFAAMHLQLKNKRSKNMPVSLRNTLDDTAKIINFI